MNVFVIYDDKEKEKFNRFFLFRVVFRNFAASNGQKDLKTE
jgi:hypothetical protein